MEGGREGGRRETGGLERGYQGNRRQEEAFRPSFLQPPSLLYYYLACLERVLVEPPHNPGTAQIKEIGKDRESAIFP